MRKNADMVQKRKSLAKPKPEQRDLIIHISATRKAIEELPSNSSAFNPYACAVGALRGMLRCLAGLSEFSTHESCFDPQVTEEVKRLLDVLDHLGQREVTQDRKSKQKASPESLATAG